MGSKGNANEKKCDAKKFERPPSASSPTEKKDVSDSQRIEKKLLQLMEDFETGKLKAFGNSTRLRQMEEIREQQEDLAKLHFDVGAEQDLYPPLSEDGLRFSEENMTTLMEKLAQLSHSIENLHSNTYIDKKTVVVDAKTSNTSSQPIAAEDVAINTHSSPTNPPSNKAHSTNEPFSHHHTHHHHSKSFNVTHTPKECRDQSDAHSSLHETSPSFVYMSNNSSRMSSPLNSNTFTKNENVSTTLQMKAMNSSQQEFSTNVKLRHHN